MSERFDTELKRSMKESTAKSLEGWEFTPSMRQAVLKRITEEEEAPAPPSVPLVRRPRHNRIAPVMWMAAAAAAFVVAFNMMDVDLGSGGTAQKAENAPMAATAEPDGATGMVQESGKPVQGAKSAKGNRTEESAAGSVALQAPGTENDKAVASLLPQETAGNRLMVAPAQPARIHLVVPEREKVAALDATGKAAIKVQPDNTGMALAVQPESLAIDGLGIQAAVRTRTAVQLVNGGSQVAWEQPLAGEAGPLVAQDGRIATSAGRQLLLFDANGQQEAKLTLVGPAQAIALSPDGRVAVLVGQAEPFDLVVYDQEKAQFQVDDLSAAAFTFGPDGALAVRADGSLSLYSRDGSRLWQAPVKTSGTGITFAAGGDVVVVGNTALHRSGQPVWEASSPLPLEAVSLGAYGPVGLWDSQRLTLVRPEDGVELWTAELSGGQIQRVVPSEAGDQMAILAAVDGGAAVWVLDQAGGIRLAERLAVQPTGVAVEADTLFLLMNDGVQTRALPLP